MNIARDIMSDCNGSVNKANSERDVKTRAVSSMLCPLEFLLIKEKTVNVKIGAKMGERKAKTRKEVFLNKSSVVLTETHVENQKFTETLGNFQLLYTQVMDVSSQDFRQTAHLNAFH
jgi:hypothetical protein